ncbi:MAG: hypothetical protein IT448_00190 [Phycisphaerales bacterium]|nr:hypothetical protein [Phycisphaerales bacterium]
MADERMTLSGINWRQTFTFTHLFRAFRVAIHPSKLILGLLLLLAVYFGGRVLDCIWPDKYSATTAEVSRYAMLMGQPETSKQLDAQRQIDRKMVADRYLSLLLQYKVYESPSEDARKAADRGERYSELKGKIKLTLADHLKSAQEQYEKDQSAAKDKSGDEKKNLLKQAQDRHDTAIKGIYAGALSDLDSIKAISGQGLFITFFKYEITQVDNLVGNVMDWNWALNGGILGNVYNFVAVGPSWLLMIHPVYFVIFFVYFLIVWAIFGGAITRIAAVHVARDEKISVRAALKFSLSKLLSFVFAPIIPLLIIVGIGVAVFVLGLVGSIPFIGPIILGLFFFLALAAGFIMTLVLLGLIGGFNLMYPTIAVEGSDSFDAISRSFSYLYARPWRMALYTAVALVYGAVTYLFVRSFIFLTLLLSHRFIDCGLFKTAYNGRDAWLEMWPKPTWANLPYDFSTLTLGAGEATGAWMVAIWNYLLIALLGAFAIAFYFSANTIIYYLMRREVDNTEMDDVYVEQVDDDFTDIAPASAEPSPASSSIASDAPASGSANQAHVDTTQAPPTSEGSPPDENPPASSEQSQNP